MAENAPRAWHRLFGVGLVDLFTDSGWRVELEKAAILNLSLPSGRPHFRLARCRFETIEHEVEQMLPGVEGEVLHRK